MILTPTTPNNAPTIDIPAKAYNMAKSRPASVVGIKSPYLNASLCVIDGMRHVFCFCKEDQNQILHTYHNYSPNSCKGNNTKV